MTLTYECKVLVDHMLTGDISSSKANLHTGNMNHNTVLWPDLLLHFWSNNARIHFPYKTKLTH